MDMRLMQLDDLDNGTRDAHRGRPATSVGVFQLTDERIVLGHLSDASDVKR